MRVAVGEVTVVFSCPLSPAPLGFLLDLRGAQQNQRFSSGIHQQYRIMLKTHQGLPNSPTGTDSIDHLTPGAAGPLFFPSAQVGDERRAVTFTLMEASCWLSNRVNRDSVPFKKHYF